MLVRLAALVLVALVPSAMAQDASAVFRNAGANPPSYVAATLPVMGSTYTATIDLGGTTGHSFAWLAGYLTPLSLFLSGGQVVLANVADPNGELLGLSVALGPVATFHLPVPSDLAFMGIALYTQAAHIGGVQPFALSNAQDLVLGSPPGLDDEMALVPGGAYEMGDHHDGMVEALPVHTVLVDSFWIDTYEVTNEKYCAYLNSAYSQGLIEVLGTGTVINAGSSEPYCDTYSASSESRITWNGSAFGIAAGTEEHPMVRVSWYGAVAYANWRSARDGLSPCYDLSTWDCDFGACGYRLPTEAEWEKAARGGEHNPYYRYPWGDSIDGSMANYVTSGDPYETGPAPHTTPVGYYDGNQTPPGSDMANGYGLYDLAGNMVELCQDWYDPSYYGLSPYDNPTGPLAGAVRVARGGSWYFIPLTLRSAMRNGFPPAVRFGHLGFRVLAAFQ